MKSGASCTKGTEVLWLPLFCYRSSCLNLCHHCYQPGVSSKGWELWHGDNDRTTETFISGSSLFIPKLTFASVPQSTWTNLTNFELWRKDRDLSPLLLESSNKCVYSCFNKDKFHWVIERRVRRRSPKFLLIGYPRTKPSNSNTVRVTDIFGRRNRSIYKSTLIAH